MAPRPPTVHELGPYSVTAATAFGPRVLALAREGGPNLFAALGEEIAVPHPGGGTFRFRGGHRLWAAPEVPDVTYAPDDHACEVTAEPDLVEISAPPDRAGLAKRIRVVLDGGALEVEHELVNASDHPVTVAPWAITQLRLGGVAVLPLGGAGGDRYQADRSLVLWPYTRLDDPRLSWSDRTVTVSATAGPRLKLGSGPDPGRLGYLLDGWLFTKTVAPATSEATPTGGGSATGVGGPASHRDEASAEEPCERAYPDRGAVGQIFVDADFAELESVGPVTTVPPGGAAAHAERWDLTACAGLDDAHRRLSPGGAP